MFNHFLKVVLQMLNLGTEILPFHSSCMELTVSELQKTSLMIVCSLWGSEYLSVAAIKQNCVFNSFGETKDLQCYNPVLDLCLISTF